MMAVALMLLTIPVARASTIMLLDTEVTFFDFQHRGISQVVKNGGNLAFAKTAFTAPVAGGGLETLTSAGTTLVLSGYSIPSGARLENRPS